MAAKTRLGLGGSAVAYKPFTPKAPDGNTSNGGGMRIIKLRRRKA